jgi:uncharacterized Zn-finger protein
LDVSKTGGKYSSKIHKTNGRKRGKTDIPNTYIRDHSLSCVGDDTPNTHIHDRSFSCVDNDTPNTHICDRSLSCVGNDTPNTHIRDRSLSCVGKMRRGGTFLWAQTPSY